MPSKKSRHLVLVVAANRETGDGLHEYFSRSGFTARTSSRLNDIGPLCANADAVVLFPDDFREEEVRAKIRTLRGERPRLLLLLVTASPQRLELVCEPDGKTLSPIVVAKPAFGWSLLDALRGQLELS